METRRLVTRTGHGGAIAFSPDATRVATGGADNTARIIDLETGQEIARMAHESGVLLSLPSVRTVNCSSQPVPTGGFIYGRRRRPLMSCGSRACTRALLRVGVIRRASPRTT